jgi:hypothetical protein
MKKGKVNEYTGYYKIGEHVKYSYLIGAYSCEWNGRHENGDGVISHIEKANRTKMYAINGKLVFESEIVRRYPRRAPR